jgi:hypothetical protein
MRILLDESAPRELKGLLLGHEVETTPERGWASKRTGELITLAVSDGFEVFVTPDQNLPYQQNLQKFDMAVVVLAAGRNRISTYERMQERLEKTILGATRGEATWLTA